VLGIPMAPSERTVRRRVTFYRLPVSNCCAGVLATLIHKNLPFSDHEPPGRYRAPSGAWRPGYGTVEYKAIVPSGTIPAVVIRGVDPGGEETEFVLSESSCIVEYLEEIAPAPPLLPSMEQPERRAQLRFAVRLHDLYIAPRVQALFPHVDPRCRDLVQVKSVIVELRAQLQRLNAEAERHAVGPKGDAVFDGQQFSLVDCCVPVTLLLAERLAGVFEEAPLLNAGRLQRWLTAVVLHPTLACVVEESQTATDEWLRRKLSGDDANMEEGWWNIGRHSYDQAIGVPLMNEQADA